MKKNYLKFSGFTVVVFLLMTVFMGASCYRNCMNMQGAGYDGEIKSNIAFAWDNILLTEKEKENTKNKEFVPSKDPEKEAFAIYFDLRAKRFRKPTDKEVHRVKELIEHYPQLAKARDDADWTLLHYSAMNGNDHVAKLLIEREADMEAKNPFGNTPLHIATAYNNESVVRLLIESGANVNAVNNYYTTPLKIARRRSCKEIIILLEDNGATE